MPKTIKQRVVEFNKLFQHEYAVSKKTNDFLTQQLKEATEEAEKRGAEKERERILKIIDISPNVCTCNGYINAQKGNLIRKIYNYD